MGIIVLILFGISAGRSLWHMFKRQCLKERNSQEEPSSKASAKRRVKAIDAFRGYERITKYNEIQVSCLKSDCKSFYLHPQNYIIEYD